jgi:ABC-type transport system involved in multi-copper enzyme maturation permease subunit
VTLVAWLYFKTTNYKNYSQNIAQKVSSPDFQLQFYQVLLQSLTFALLLFIAAQTFVYVLGLRNFRSAFFYLKYFCVLGFALSIFITFTSSFFALLPAIFYLFGYYIFAKEFKESTAIMQNQHL